MATPRGCCDYGDGRILSRCNKHHRHPQPGLTLNSGFQRLANDPLADGSQLRSVYISGHQHPVAGHLVDSQPGLPKYRGHSPDRVYGYSRPTLPRSHRRDPPGQMGPTTTTTPIPLRPHRGRPLNPRNTEGVLLDFDGTLAPNLDLPDMRRQVITKTQAAGVPSSIYAEHYIVEMIAVATEWLDQHTPAMAQNYYTEAHALITDFELTAAAETQPFDGIHDTLAALRHQGLRLGVVTRNCRAAVLEVFPDLLTYIDSLSARDDTPHLKPDPRHLRATLDRLGVLPKHAVMVGDGQLDMQAGRALNMHCIGVLSGSGSPADLHAAGAHEVLNHCNALPDNLTQAFRVS